MSLSRRSLLITPLAAWASSLVWSKTASPASESHPVTVQRTAWAGIRLELIGVTLFIDAIAPNPAAIHEDLKPIDLLMRSDGRWQIPVTNNTDRRHRQNDGRVTVA